MVHFPDVAYRYFSIPSSFSPIDELSEDKKALFETLLADYTGTPFIDFLSSHLDFVLNCVYHSSDCSDLLQKAICAHIPSVDRVIQNLHSNESFANIVRELSMHKIPVLQVFAFLNTCIDREIYFLPTSLVHPLFIHSDKDTLLASYAQNRSCPELIKSLGLSFQKPIESSPPASPNTNR